MDQTPLEINQARYISPAQLSEWQENHHEDDPEQNGQLQDDSKRDAGVMQNKVFHCISLLYDTC